MTVNKANSGVTDSDTVMVVYYGTCHESRSACEDGDKQASAGVIVMTAGPDVVEGENRVLENSGGRE
jgi:hypothetical protein